MDPRLTNAQRDLDALLPEFMTIASPDKLKGTCWITVTDLALTRTTRSEDKADKSVLFIEGAWPSPDRRANVLLQAASRLRFDGCFWELWAFAYLAGVWLDLRVEGGPMDGLLVSLFDEDRWLASGAVGRRTAAAVCIASEEIVAAGDAAAIGASRRAALLAIVEAGQSLPGR